MRHRATTPLFRGPEGQPLPGSVAEIDSLRLGGLDQWVMIRGEDVSNPLLILLHGGPGFPETRLFRHFNAPVEKAFTVVYWEQRGTGRSFHPRIPVSSMTVAQFIADLDELVDAMRRRFGKSRVSFYGHSWGSALGVLYAARFPDKVAAYVGAGQIGSWPASESMSYAFVLAEAGRRKHRRALAQLRAIGRPPYDARAKMTQGKWLGRFFGVVRGMPLLESIRIILSGPEASMLDVPRILRGMRFSQKTMWPEVSVLDLVTAVPALHVPVFFFLGRHTTSSRPRRAPPISTRWPRHRSGSCGSKNPPTSRRSRSRRNSLRQWPSWCARSRVDENVTPGPRARPVMLYT